MHKCKLDYGHSFASINYGLIMESWNACQGWVFATAKRIFAGTVKKLVKNGKNLTLVALFL